MVLQFSGALFHWAGPSPFHFVTVPDTEAQMLRDLSRLVTYGWGMIPVRAQIGDTTFKPSLFPKDGGYLLPVKDSVRRAEQLQPGDIVTAHLDVS